MLATGATALALVISQAIGGSGAVAASGAATAASGASERVIVMLNDSLASTPDTVAHSAARTAKATSLQKGVLARMAGPAAKNVHHLTLGNAFTAVITTGQAAALRLDPAVKSVTADHKLAAPATSASAAGTSPGAAQTKAQLKAMSKAAAAPKASSTSAAKAVATSGKFAVCPADPSKPLLEPEALTSIHAASTDGSPSAQDLATGAGVKVAYLADGIDPNNPDFIRPNGQHVIVDYKDFGGDGPLPDEGGAEAFGDASSIAAQGTVSHDLSKFVNAAYPLPAGCNIRILGVAPGASIVALKVFGANGTDVAELQAIDYAVTVDHVDVINESLGLNQFPDSSSRADFQAFNDAAIAAGVTVTNSSGDAGVTGTVGSPAADPLTISVGASTDNRLYAQTGYAMAGLSNHKWVSDNISALSSAGITQEGRTIDLTAPGEGNWAVCENNVTECPNFQSPPKLSDIQSFGGTSESAPLTAGVAALVIQAYRSTHHGNSPTPAVVKKIITSTATDMGLPADEQGSGLLNARAAVEEALTYPGTKGSHGVKSHIALSTDQFTVHGAPGTTQTRKVRVTNVGGHALSVKTGSRTFSTFSSHTKTTSFNSTTLPTVPYATTGVPWAVQKTTFSVPKGTERLSTQMIWQGAASGPKGADTIVRLTLLAPDGTLVANSRPQGGPATPDYSNLDVRTPVSGTWTAVFYSLAGAAGYTGPITLRTQNQHAVSVGNVSPSHLSLAPGQKKSVSVRFKTPPSGGDAAYSVTFADSNGGRASVSAVLRALIPIKHSVGHFTGTITGGNARAQSPGQTFSYEFDVPSHQRDLGVSLKLTKGAGDIVDAVLIAPNGEVGDINSNVFVAPDGNLLQGTGVQTFDAAPQAGRWRLVVVVQNPVTGTELRQTLLGAIILGSVHASAPGLPTSSAVKLTKGVAKTVQLHFTNTGVEPVALGVEGRTQTQQTMAAVPIQGSESFKLPEDLSNAPVYQVPPETNRFSVTAASALKLQAQIQNGTGSGLELVGTAGNTSTASVSEFVGNVTQGFWFSNATEIGPFPDGGAPAGTATQTASVRTFGFDPAVTSAAGDPYLNGVNASAPEPAPVVVAPGDSVTIPVTITPGAAKGSVVTGHLNLVTLPNLPTGATGLPFHGTGSVVAQLPYSYQVG
jgi:Subtilase family